MPSALIVHSLAADRRAIGRHLTDHGIEAIEAATADDAASIIRERRPDVVVSDVMIPPYESAEALAVIVGHASAAHIPVIVMSGLLADEGWRALAKQAGAVACIAHDPSGLATLALLVESLSAVQRQIGLRAEAQILQIAQTMLGLAEQTERAILAIADSDERATFERRAVIATLGEVAEKIEAIETWLQRQVTIERVIAAWTALSPTTKRVLIGVLAPLLTAIASYWGVAGVADAIDRLFATAPTE